MTSGLGSFPGRDKKISSFQPVQTYHHAHTVSYLIGTVSTDASERGVKLASRLLLVSRLRISRRAAPLTMYVHGEVQLTL